MPVDPIGTIALVWRGSREARLGSTAPANRLNPLFAAMAEVGLVAEAAVYLDEMIDDVREQLLRVDGVLVWVDPIAEGGDRSKLDPLLREVSSHGIWVSAHPDVILKMGTKEVLVRTKSLGWGSDCHVYESVEQLREQLPRRLASGATRVLKQHRGNGGIGVYRVVLRQPLASTIEAVTLGTDAIVQTQHARMGSAPRDMSLGDFMSHLEKYFAGESDDRSVVPGAPRRGNDSLLHGAR
jgi:hypothetical protein